MASTARVAETDGKGGVFWHTQGSGKSLSMVFYAHLLQSALNSPTIVVLTDRNDLDDQLFGQFAKCKAFLRQEPIQAESREHLKKLLAGRKANDIIFTTMQKFRDDPLRGSLHITGSNSLRSQEPVIDESDGPLSERRNIVVMADEAHRGQYGLTETIRMTRNEAGEEVAKRVVGTAWIKLAVQGGLNVKFELNEYKSKLSDEEILNDVKVVARKLNVDYISISTYKLHGKYSQTAIKGHFGTWKTALSLAGLRTERLANELKIISDDEYYADLKRVADIIKMDTVPYDKYDKYGRYSATHIIHRFGKWNLALAGAGLNATGFSKDKITHQQCFDEIERMWRLLGRQPTSTDIIKNKISKYSIDAYKRRFGGWRKALEAFIQYINATDNVDDLDTQNFETFPKTENRNQRIDNNRSSDTLILHRTSRNINTRLRFKVLQRDHFKCCACGASPAKDSSVELHVDHIVPWSKGGETIIENLQTLCSRCNLGKSDVL